MLPDDSYVVERERRVESIAGDAARWYGGLGGGVLAALLAAGAAVLRRGDARREGSVVAIFWRDTATILLVLAGTAGLASVALVLAVDGLGNAVWLLATGIALVAITGILVWKWKREVRRYARQRTVVPTGTPDRRIVSSAWETGAVVAGVGGLLLYVATADHVFGHPIHWLLAVVGVLLGYAFGIGIATPRFHLEQPTRKR